MALESYRRQRVISKSANADFGQIIMLNAGDVDGRIVRFEAAKGNGRANTACKLWIDKGEGLAVFCELIRVDMPTPTWEAAIPVRGLDVGMYDAAIRLEDVDGSITETMPLRVQVVGSILAESEATEEMQDALDDFETRTAIAITAANAATAAANSAAASAASAASDAYDAANRADQSRVAADTAEAARASAEEIRVAAEDARATAETARATAETARASAEAERQAAEALRASAETARASAETARVSAETARASAETARETASRQATEAATTAAESATSAASSANSAAASATSAASSANSAATSANSAALAANSAATSATSAAGTATGAAETATSAAGSANTAATAATSAANAANSAATSASSAATAATNAATTATNAANSANTAAGNAATATENANSATTAANTAAETATDAAAAASDAAEDATDAATEARDAAAAALASVGNIVLGEISMLDGSIETVDDAWPSPLRGIEVEGKSTQASIAGNQLYKPFSYTTVNHGVDAVTSLDGAISVNGTSNGNAYSIEVPDATAGGYYSTLGAGEYTLSGASAECPLQIVIDGVAKYNTTSTQTFTLEQQSNVIIQTFIASGRTVNTAVKPMLNAGSTALPWEPYVGGIPSPNPDFPQAIHSVAEAGQVVAGRNLFQIRDRVHTHRGITFTTRTDNTVSIVGTATETADSALSDNRGNGVPPYNLLYLPVGTYRITAYGLVSGVKIVIGGSSGNNGFPYTELLSSAPSAVGAVAYGDKPFAHIIVRVTSGTTVNATINLKIESYSFPQSDFVPYLGTTTPLIPSGIEPLRSLPNGVHDELIVRADGSREIVRRVGVVDIESSTGTYVVYGDYKCWQINVPLLASISSSVSDRQNCRSNVFSVKTYENNAVPVTGANTDLINGSICIYRSGDTKLVFVGLPGETAGTWSDFAAWYEENDCVIIYPLETPVIEPLPSISMPSAPSSDVTAWLDSKDETSAPIATDSSVSYERSMQIVIDKLEQAIADL